MVVEDLRWENDDPLRMSCEDCGAFQYSSILPPLRRNANNAWGAGVNNTCESPVVRVLLGPTCIGLGWSSWSVSFLESRAYWISYLIPLWYPFQVELVKSDTSDFRANHYFFLPFKSRTVSHFCNCNAFLKVWVPSLADTNIIRGSVVV